MASYHDLLDAIARIRSVTGDPDAWKKGLTGDDVSTAVNPASPPAALGAVLVKLTAAHPEVFLSDSPAGPPGPPPRIGEGAAADAIRDAEAALASQNTDAAHVDLQVVTALLNAHAAHDDGLAELTALQHEIEHAVTTRPDLDTPAGAREFQRYLIGKLRDIRNVLENSGLDATSKASLAAALATLYAASSLEPQDRVPAAPRAPDPPEPAPSEWGGLRRPTAESASSAMVHPAPAEPWDPGPTLFPVTDAELLPSLTEWSDPPPSGPGMQSPAAAPPAPSAAAPGPMPLPPMSLPPMTAPAWGAGLPAGAPFGGPLPAMSPGLGSTSAPPSLPEPPRPDFSRHNDTGPAEVSDSMTDRVGEAPTEESIDDPADPTPPGDDATTVNLPDGDIVTAPSPELAAAITAAVGGTPIAEAFRQQGISLPAPGSVVTAPLDPGRLGAGDIGVFTDRHALALGNGKALLDQQIQPIASVMGPGFLGWQHPPEPETSTATPDVPAPNRAAATAPS